jgi:predicted metal-dependent enzyme (double-stranded beta helix superfamily)
MSYTLDQFAADCRDALANNPGPEGLEQVRQYVEKALKDEALVAEYLPEDAEQERRVLYEDPDLKFCICAHVYNGPKDGFPHDHGPTWAIYGQAVGETEMTDWKIVQPASGDDPALVEQTRSYKLVPGDAHVYQVGDVHAPLRSGPTRLIRIEGENTDNISRTPIKAA